MLCVPITRARALPNRLAPAHSPAPFGEADAAERQLEFAQLLQGTYLLDAAPGSFHSFEMSSLNALESDSDSSSENALGPFVPKTFLQLVFSRSA